MNEDVFYKADEIIEEKMNEMVNRNFKISSTIKIFAMIIGFLLFCALIFGNSYLGDGTCFFCGLVATCLVLIPLISEISESNEIKNKILDYKIKNKTL